MFNKNDFIEFIYSIVIYDLKKKKRERWTKNDFYNHLDYYLFNLGF